MRTEPQLRLRSTFTEIWEVVARIPRGRVATYGQVARMAGFPGGARTVGWAMRAVPDGLRIDGRPVPWQRVINSAGGISLPLGPGSPGDRQARLLRREGIVLSRNGRADLAVCRWDGAEGRYAAGRASDRRRIGARVRRQPDL